MLRVRTFPTRAPSAPARPPMRPYANSDSRLDACPAFSLAAPPHYHTGARQYTTSTQPRHTEANGALPPLPTAPQVHKSRWRHHYPALLPVQGRLLSVVVSRILPLNASALALQ